MSIKRVLRVLLQQTLHMALHPLLLAAVKVGQVIFYIACRTHLRLSSPVRLSSFSISLPIPIPASTSVFISLPIPVPIPVPVSIPISIPVSFPLPLPFPLSISRLSKNGFRLLDDIHRMYVWQQLAPRIDVHSHGPPVRRAVLGEEAGFDGNARGLGSLAGGEHCGGYVADRIL